MSIQIVISGNRVLSHGTDFSVSNNTVKCESTGRIYNNATIATVDSVPDDIDSVGYEYHAGRFVPCGPFGLGSGNVAVLCGEDCKAIKDSGVPMENFAAAEYTTYKCDIGEGVSLTFNIKPDVLFIITEQSPYSNYVGLIFGENMFCIGPTDADRPVRRTGTVDKDGYTVSWDLSGSSNDHFETTGVTYQVYAFSVKGA